LRFFQKFGKLRENTSGERNISQFHRNTGLTGKRLNNWKKRVGRKHGRFVCKRPDNGWQGTHNVLRMRDENERKRRLRPAYKVEKTGSKGTE
jgi:hypothetical protein